MQKEKNYCFCSLALGEKYCHAAKDLAQDLEVAFPNVWILILTDHPSFFKNLKNVLIKKHRQQGILYARHDKRCVIDCALKKFDSAIFIDSDSRFRWKDVDIKMEWHKGVNVGCTFFSLNHMLKNKEFDDQILVYKDAIESWLGVDFNKAKFFDTRLFIITKDSEKEKLFLKTWQRLEFFLFSKKISVGDGFIQGLAATKVGWEPQSSECLKYLLNNTTHGKAVGFCKKNIKNLNTFFYYYRFLCAKINIFLNYELLYNLWKTADINKDPR